MLYLPKVMPQVRDKVMPQVRDKVMPQVRHRVKAKLRPKLKHRVRVSNQQQVKVKEGNRTIVFSEPCVFASAEVMLLTEAKPKKRLFMRLLKPVLIW